MLYYRPDLCFRALLTITLTLLPKRGVDEVYLYRLQFFVDYYIFPKNKRINDKKKRRNVIRCIKRSRPWNTPLMSMRSC